MLLHPSRLGRRNLTQWHCIALTANQVRAFEPQRIKRLFECAYRATRWRSGMCLWLEPNDDGSVNIFLPPVTVSAEPGLVHHFNAISCTRPRGSLRLFAGSASMNPTNRVRKEGKRLPAMFNCRSVRRARKAGHYQSHELAPFVRRYLDAWSHPTRPSVRH